MTAELLDRHGLSREEYERILKALGREPSLTELGIFSVMWSEHCSYKSSRVHLKTLPTTGRRVLQGPGENAGAVDIGDGLAAVFLHAGDSVAAREQRDPDERDDKNAHGSSCADGRRAWVQR